MAATRLILRVGGVSVCVVLASATLISAPTTLFSFMYSLILPLTQFGHCVNPPAGFESLVFLPCALTAGYMTCLLLLVVLCPFVFRFQIMRASVRSSKGFPDSFYSPATIKELYLRYDAALHRTSIQRVIASKVGRFNAIRVLAFLDEGARRLPYV